MEALFLCPNCNELKKGTHMQEEICNKCGNIMKQVEPKLAVIPSAEETLLSFCEYAKDQHSFDEWIDKFITTSFLYGHNSSISVK
ncbi:MAG: hypothetical protein VB078_09035 [Clostridiaceae bacterium]|nr:hypothetical protein [Clostridiaceae bacterium]